MSACVQPQPRCPVCKKRRRCLSAARLRSALPLSGLAGLLPGHKYTHTNRSEYVFTAHPYLSAYRLLSRLPSERVASVLFDVQEVVTSTGQYYYLHHDVGIYFPWTYEEHRRLVDAGDIQDSMSHVITKVPRCFPGFAVIDRAGDLAIMENENVAAVAPPHPDRLLQHFTVNEELRSYYNSQTRSYHLWLRDCSGPGH